MLGKKIKTKRVNQRNLNEIFQPSWNRLRVYVKI